MSEDEWDYSQETILFTKGLEVVTVVEYEDNVMQSTEWMCQMYERNPGCGCLCSMSQVSRQTVNLLPPV